MEWCAYACKQSLSLSLFAWFGGTFISDVYVCNDKVEISEIIENVGDVVVRWGLLSKIFSSFLNVFAHWRT